VVADREPDDVIGSKADRRRTPESPVRSLRPYILIEPAVSINSAPPHTWLALASWNTYDPTHLFAATAGKCSPEELNVMMFPAVPGLVTEAINRNPDPTTCLPYRVTLPLLVYVPTENPV